MASQESKSKYWMLFCTGLFFGLLNSYFITEAVKRIPLGIAFTIFSASSILLLTLVSNVYFNESMTAKKMIGIIVICIGILLLVHES